MPWFMWLATVRRRANWYVSHPTAIAPVARIDIDDYGSCMSRLSRSLALIPLALIITLSGMAYFNEQAASFETLHRALGNAVTTRAAVPFSGRVTDAAHILSSQFQSKLSGKLAKFERSTHHQMVVVTVSTLVLAWWGPERHL
jgi:hypothetical protein